MKNLPKNLSTTSNREAVLDERRLLLAFKEPTTPEKVSSLIEELKLTLVETGKGQQRSRQWSRINHTAKRYWVETADGSPIGQDRFAEIKEKLGNELDWIGPVYIQPGSRQDGARFCPLPHVLLFEKSDKLRRQQNEVIKKFKLDENKERSKHLSAFRCFELKTPEEQNAYMVAASVQENSRLFSTMRYENMPMFKPLLATIPNDPQWAAQWNMVQINAPNAWDIDTGSNAVAICILDEGCDLDHDDLQFSGDGINLGTMSGDGSPTGPHGTACAGIAAATFDNSIGVAGLAGGCLILPAAFDSWTDVECANGINYATTEGASIISMSFGVYDGWGWDYTIIDPEIDNAFANDLVMCVATGNEDDGSTNRYPGRHHLVIAVGGTSTDDNRKTPASPDGECWGANYGEDTYNGEETGVSVVAPCVLCPTTDISGADGYNDNGTLDPNPWACVNYGAQPTDGDYVLVFDGTSAATPHVAGLAGLIRSEYPALSNVEVRDIIERTAAKVGTLAYADDVDFPNGTRNQEMGYGRIDAFQSLDFGDIMIKDWSGDDGTEPSTPPSNNFWSYSDIVVRITDDNVFEPNDPAKSKNVERGQTNYIYIKITNNGPSAARNVTVDFRITPYVGLQFIYPDDWSQEDAMHVRPTPVTASFANIPSGGSEIAKFTISAAQTDTLYGWQYSNPWHPCLLAQVNSDNDYAFASSDLSYGNLVLRKNNIAQRNLSVIDVLASPSASIVNAPFVAGHRLNTERRMSIRVDRSGLPVNASVFLSLDDDGDAFPEVDFTRQIDPGRVEGGKSECDCEDQWVFLSKTKVRTRFGCCEGVLTLEKGSVFEFICERERAEILDIKGGNLKIRDGRRLIELSQNMLLVELEKEPGALYPMSVRVQLPGGIEAGEEYSLSVSQLDASGQTVGGADTAISVK